MLLNETLIKIGHQKILSLPYVDDVLRAAKSEFCKRFREPIQNGEFFEEDFGSFGVAFSVILDAYEKSHHEVCALVCGYSMH